MVQHIWYPLAFVTGPIGHILVVDVWTVLSATHIPNGMSDEPEILDALGLLCPLPVLKARKRLKSMPVGGVLRVMADDPAAIIDVPHFCAESGHTLIAREEAQTHQVYVIQKAK